MRSTYLHFMCTLATQQYFKNGKFRSVYTFDLFFRPIVQCSSVALVVKPLLDSLGIIVCGTIIKH